MTASPFTVSNVECIDLARSSHPISSGVGFLDHMMDQFNSHAQVGVAITVGEESGADKHNRHAEMDQSILLPQCGAELGKHVKEVLKDVSVGAASRFCCPLDEALVECQLTKVAETGKLVAFSLAPYGIYPKSTGRTKIGCMVTKHVEGFMRGLAEESGLEISLQKVRGDNGHHIVESAFKALSRALRNLLDGTSTNEYESATFTALWGRDSESWKQSIALNREGKHDRNTKETSILVDLKLDGGVTGVSIETGIPALDEIFETLAEEAKMSLTIKCRGDLFVDDHHTSEDVSIALGQVLTTSFGTKAGLNRMWCAKAEYGAAEVEVTMDLSNRPCLTHNLTLTEDEYVSGTLTTEMFDHVLDSLTVNARMTVHILELKKGATVEETALATAMAFGRSLQMCAAVDPRRAGKTASSKGTLSV
jgi:imidazoleglycerol-phosphate dehydratase